MDPATKAEEAEAGDDWHRRPSTARPGAIDRCDSARGGCLYDVADSLVAGNDC
jgi:hypothetical protein